MLVAARRRFLLPLPLLLSLLLSLLVAALTASSPAQAPAAANDSSAASSAATATIHWSSTGQRLTPRGTLWQTAPYPYAVAVRPDGQQAIAAAIGFPFSLNVVDLAHPDAPVLRLPAPTCGPVKDWGNDAHVEVHTGLAYSRDGRYLFVSSGDSGAVVVYDTGTWRPVLRIPLDAPGGRPGWHNSFSAALALAPDGQRLYVLDQGNWRVAIFRLAWRPAAAQQAAAGGGTPLTARLLASLRTGRNPEDLALAPDGRRLYVTNSGMFEYRPLTRAGHDLRHAAPDAGLGFAPFAYPSPEAERGVTVDGYHAAGLGDFNDLAGSSLWTATLAPRPHWSAKLRFGDPIAAPAGGTSSSAAVVGGASPSGVASDGRRVFVALAHTDAVAIVSADGSRELSRVPLSPFAGAAFRDRDGRPLRGVMPSALALARGRLFVAETGINAVAVLDAATGTLLGHLPTAWTPSALALAGDRLLVANARGLGAGPNGGAAFHSASGVTYIAAREFGDLEALPLPAAPADWAAATSAVVHNNTVWLAPGGALPPIHHVYLIIKENRTFDEVLGDLAARHAGLANGHGDLANGHGGKAGVAGQAALAGIKSHAGQAGVDGDAGLARYGERGWTGPGRERARPGAGLTGVDVTPNHHALARQFAINDHFTVASEVSVDGHHWVMNAPPTPWLSVAWRSSYAGRRHADIFSASPGRRAMSGGADSVMPEDEPEWGSWWEHLASAGVSIRDYGEGLEIEGGHDLASAPEGHRLLLNAPLPAPVFASADRAYPTFNLGIPDQDRVREFFRDFDRRAARGQLAAFTVIRLPNDHTTTPHPDDGYPYRASYVADNDLALGRIVEHLSHLPSWKDSAIFVTEDDAQDGVDHVDAHRSLLLVISPYATGGIVAHRPATTLSIARTIDELLGVGPGSLDEALAPDLSEMFHAKPDAGLYQTRPSDPRLFDPARARRAHPKTLAERQALLDCDDPAEIAAAQRQARRRLGQR